MTAVLDNISFRITGISDFYFKVIGFENVCSTFRGGKSAAIYSEVVFFFFFLQILIQGNDSLHIAEH